MQIREMLTNPRFAAICPKISSKTAISHAEDGLVHYFLEMNGHRSVVFALHSGDFGQMQPWQRRMGVEPTGEHKGTPAQPF
jgi:hypothetical protein